MKHTILLISLLMISPEILACSPVFNGKKVSVKTLTKESFESNDVIAIALVTKIERNSQNEVNTHFNILHSYKGNLKSFETGWDAACVICSLMKGRHMFFMPSAMTTAIGFRSLDYHPRYHT